MDHPDTPAAEKSYWDGFRTQMGPKMVRAHILSHPQWWKLRDGLGRCALMNAVSCRGMSTDMLDMPHMPAQGRCHDKQGRGLLFYLIRSGHLGGPHLNPLASRWLDWLRRLNVDFFKVARTGRGLIIQTILETPQHKYGRFVIGLCAAADFARTHISADAPLDRWWASSESGAEQAAHWIGNVRSLSTFSISWMSHLMHATLSPDELLRLPAVLRSVLVLNEASGKSWLSQDVANMVIARQIDDRLTLEDITDQRLDAFRLLAARGPGGTAQRLDDVLARASQNVLRQRLVAGGHVAGRSLRRAGGM